MSEVAYTIGNMTIYDKAIQDSLINDEPLPSKIGRYQEPDESYYYGGWVWKTCEKAINFLNSGDFTYGWEGGVYEIMLPTSWAMDIQPILAGEKFHRLLNDAIIKKRVYPV